MSAKKTQCRAIIAALVVLTFSGCGGDGGYDLSGKVLFDGKPIPAGKIYFTPDHSKKNAGAAGFADIKEGEFNTASAGGKKHIGGPMIVRIEGFDPSQKGDAPGDSGGETVIKSLFPAYETAVELNKQKGTKDFDVPAIAAKALLPPEAGGLVIP